jgi:hypothetical protein
MKGEPAHSRAPPDSRERCAGEEAGGLSTARAAWTTMGYGRWLLQVLEPGPAAHALRQALHADEMRIEQLPK